MTNKQRLLREEICERAGTYDADGAILDVAVEMIEAAEEEGREAGIREAAEWFEEYSGFVGIWDECKMMLRALLTKDEETNA